MRQLLLIERSRMYLWMKPGEKWSQGARRPGQCEANRKWMENGWSGLLKVCGNCYRKGREEGRQRARNGKWLGGVSRDTCKWLNLQNVTFGKKEVQWIARRTYPTSPELGEVGEEKSLYLRELQREHTQGSQGWVEASKQRAHSEDRPPPQGALLSPIWSFRHTVKPYGEGQGALAAEMNRVE